MKNSREGSRKEEMKFSLNKMLQKLERKGIDGNIFLNKMGFSNRDNLDKVNTKYFTGLISALNRWGSK